MQAVDSFKHKNKFLLDALDEVELHVVSATSKKYP